MPTPYTLTDTMPLRADTRPHVTTLKCSPVPAWGATPAPYPGDRAEAALGPDRSAGRMERCGAGELRSSLEKEVGSDSALQGDPYTLLVFCEESQTLVARPGLGGDGREDREGTGKWPWTAPVLTQCSVEEEGCLQGRGAPGTCHGPPEGACTGAPPRPQLRPSAHPTGGQRRRDAG